MEIMRSYHENHPCLHRFPCGTIFIFCFLFHFLSVFPLFPLLIHRYPLVSFSFTSFINHYYPSLDSLISLIHIQTFSSSAIFPRYVLFLLLTNYPIFVHSLYLQLLHLPRVSVHRSPISSTRILFLNSLHVSVINAFKTLHKQLHRVFFRVASITQEHRPVFILAHV